MLHLDPLACGFDWIRLLLLSLLLVLVLLLSLFASGRGGGVRYMGLEGAAWLEAPASFEVPPREIFDQTSAALLDVGVGAPAVAQLWGLVAAVLHLGDVVRRPPRRHATQARWQAGRQAGTLPHVLTSTALLGHLFLPRSGSSAPSVDLSGAPPQAIKHKKK